MRKKHKKRTSLQKWASERCFGNYGTLIGIKTRLIQIQKCDSTLEQEKININKILKVLQKLISNWQKDLYQEGSKEKYLEIHKKD